MKVGETIEIISHFVAGKEHLCFEDFLEVAKIYYEKLGFVCVPFSLVEESGKVKKRPLGSWGKLRKEGVSWEEIESYWWESVKKRGREDVKKKSLVSGIGVLTGKVSGVTVIDIDDVDKFVRTVADTDELIKQTLAQRTPSGGIHLIYRYDEKLKTGTYREYGLDVRNDDALAVIFPSFVPLSGKRYEFINEKVSEIAEIPEEVRKKILGRIGRKRKEAVEEGEKSLHLLSVKKNTREDMKRVAELLGELYREEKVSGHEDIDFAFVGGLVELGYEDAEIHELLKEVYGEEYDEELTQYVIERARERIEKGERYISMGTLIYKLKKLEDERAKEILSVLSPKSKFLTPDFVEKGGILFKVTKKGMSVIAPAIKLVGKIVSEEETLYIAKYEGKEFLLPVGRQERMVEVVENETGICVARPKEFKEYLVYEQKKENLKEYTLVKRTGWEGEIFRIPTAEREGEVWELPNLESFTVKGEREKHYELVKDVLKSGSDLVILVLSSLSAPLIRLCSSTPFLVHVSGKPATGKTTACSFAVSLFYNGKEYFTLNATQNALELLLSRYLDLPILLDEEELSRDPQMLINLAYMLFSSKGKSRATKTLKVKQTEVRSVVFTTSEHSVEDTLEYLEGKGVVTKLGAMRRILHVEVGDTFWEGVSFKEIERSLGETFGHFGRDWIAWLEGNVERVREVYETERGKSEVKGSEHIFDMLRTARRLLEEFLGEDLSRAQKVIEKFEVKQREKLERKVDTDQRFRELFLSFVASNYTRFYSKEVRNPKEPSYGKIEEGEVFVFEEALKEFLKERGFPLSRTLRELEGKGIIQRGKLRVKDILTEGYFVSFEVEEEKEVESFEDIEFREGFTFRKKLSEEEEEEIRVRCMESGLKLVKEGDTYRIVKSEEEEEIPF